MKKLILSLALLASVAVPGMLLAPREASAGSELACVAGQSDVSQQVYVSNATSSQLGHAGSQILWTRTPTVAGATNSGVITLDKPLCAKGVTSKSCQSLATQLLVNQPGNGFQCNASWKLIIKKL